MIRRGGHRNGEKYLPEAVDAKVLSIRTANARVAGEQTSSNVNAGGGGNGTDRFEEMRMDMIKEETGESETTEPCLVDNEAYYTMWNDLTQEKSAIVSVRGLPGDFANFDCTSMESGLLKMVSPETNWEMEWCSNEADQWITDTCEPSAEEKSISDWWAENQATCTKSLESKIRQLMLESARAPVG